MVFVFVSRSNFFETFVLAPTVSAEIDDCLGNEGQQFTVWRNTELSKEMCSFTDKKVSKKYYGTCNRKEICETNGGRPQTMTPSVSDKIEINEKCPRKSDYCCVIDKSCEYKALIDGVSQRQGYCMNPIYCTNAAGGKQAQANVKCGVNTDKKQLTCCMEEKTGTVSVECSKRYTSAFNNYMNVYTNSLLPRGERVHNFLPFILHKYEHLQDRCPKLGDCTGPAYMTFALHLLADVTSLSPETEIDKILANLKETSPGAANLVTELLAKESHSGQLTPRAFAELLGILWEDKTLDLEQYNMATCPDWLRLGSAVKGVGNAWPCDDMWRETMAAFGCPPTRSSSLPDCASGKGICSMDATTGGVGQCASLVELTSYKSECSKYHPHAICCEKVQPMNTTISFIHNEYHNVHVAIDPAVPESKTFLDNLKKVLNAASKKLYIATDFRAFIRSWRIILPNTWSTTYANAKRTDERWQDAQFIIHPEHEDTTFTTKTTMNTIQIGQCGGQGFGTYLTPKDVNPASDLSSSNIVKHFAFNRYGIFPEFPRNEMEMNPKVGILDHHIQRCVKDPTGNTTYRYCDDNLEIHWDAQNPDGAIASLAWLPDYAPEQFHTHMITHFCDSRACDPKTHHNIEMENTHNRICHRIPTFNIILQSTDFIETAPRRGVYDEAEFVIVHNRYGKEDDPTVAHIVLVLDQSGSMDGKPMQNLKMAASQFIDLLDPSIKLAIVSFDHEAYVRSDFVVADKGGKAALYEAVKMIEPQGFTCIQSGVNKSVELLQAAGVVGGQIILMTDGENFRCGPEGSILAPAFLEDVTPEIREQRAIVHTVAITEEADKTLEKLAYQTGGHAYFISDAEKLVNFVVSMQSLLVEVVQSDSQNHILLVVNEMPLKPGYGEVADLTIETGLSKSTSVNVFYQREHRPFSGELVSPTTGAISRCIDVPDFSKIVCTTTVDEGGVWKLVMTSRADSRKGNFSVVYSATATISSGQVSSAISINGRMHAKRFYVGDAKPQTDNPLGIPEAMVMREYWSNNREQMQVVVATVSFGNYAVLDAEVLALIDTPDGKRRPPIKLMDDGKSFEDWSYKGVDLYKNDGVYSGMFSLEDKTLIPGRYSVTLRVTGKTTKTFFTPHLLLGIPKSDNFLAQLAATRKYVEFTRDIQIGVFEVIDPEREESATGRRRSLDEPLPRHLRLRAIDSPSDVLDQLPPGRVPQLKIASIVAVPEAKATRYTFSWIAVGKNGMVGAPSHYFLNASTNFLEAIGRGREIEIAAHIEGRKFAAEYIEVGERDSAGNAMIGSILLDWELWRPKTKVHFSVVAFGSPVSWGLPSNIVIQTIPDVSALAEYCGASGDCSQFIEGDKENERGAKLPRSNPKHHYHANSSNRKNPNNN